ncbi:MAG: PD40 domain-containing protein [Chitinophagales bacterium]|nr:PD40 domain-containing protein [Chitinophagales bacterium]
MKRFFTGKVFWVFIFIISFSSFTYGEIMWANKLLSYSSQLDEKAYSAKQALGPPSKLPSLGDCGCAWSTSMPNNNLEEFIRVGFEKRIKVRQIIVSENFNAGSIKAIYLFDQYNIPHLVYERTKINAEYGRVFTIAIPETDFATNDLKLVLDTESVAGYNQIDAIGISSAEETLSKTIIDITTRIEFKGSAQRMEYGINSPGSEITPLISPDGKRLYFTRKDHPQNTGTIMNDDVWYVEQTGDDWSVPVNPGSPINNENNNYVIGISPDGNMLSLANTYMMDGSATAGVAQTWTKNDLSWRMPVNLMTQGIITYNMFAEYYMNTDRNVLLLALEKADSYGLKDIYVSFSENQVVWTKPLNLGLTINSVSNEMAPFLSPDGTLLFFSSDGLPGYGEQDIYVSYRLDETWTKWSKPENLGPKVNSDGFEAYFTYSDSNDYAYFTSTRDEYFNPDIYRIPLKEIPVIKEDTVVIIEEPVVELKEISTEDEPEIPGQKEVDVELTNDYLLFGTVFDAGTELPMEAHIIFRMNDYIDTSETINTLNKNYRKKITGNVSYNVTVIKEGYLIHEQIVTITDFNAQKVKRVDFRLEPIKKGETFILDNMFFDANSAKIKSQSLEQLEVLYEFLETNAGLNIEVAGHTNGLCDDEYCISLSRNRATAVMNYLIDKGIPADRLRASGYGKQKPITSNDTPEGRKKNQRVEITIL